MNPTYIDVGEGSPAQVECHASSASPVTYHWSRLDGELSPDAYVSGGWLQFNQVRHSDVGSYQCVARNQYGDDTSVLQIYVRTTEPTQRPQPVREVEISPSSFRGRPGDVVVLRCTNVVNVYATLEWSKSGERILPSHIDAREGVLTIHQATAQDTGRYVCTSTYSTDEPSSQTIQVDIHDQGGHDGGDHSGHHGEGPKVQPLNELYTVVQGQDFSLSCDVSGNPYPVVTWRKIHEDSIGSNVQQNGNILRILNAQPDNRGVYACTAESNGQTAEASTVIDIERKYFSKRKPKLSSLYPFS